MNKRSRVLGLVLSTLVSATVATGIAPVPTTAASAAPSGAGFRCVSSPFGHTADGRITFREVVNTRVKVAKATRGPVGWRPLSWGLVSSYSGPGFARTRQLVASTDGKVRLVRTEWDSKDDTLDVEAVKVVGRGYPRRLVAVDDHFVYWVATDRSLRRARWTGSRLVRPTTLPIKVRGATTLTSFMTDYGMRIFYTDRKGALHVVADRGARSTDTVLRPSGYRGVTGLEVGYCMSPSYTEVRPYLGVLSVTRDTGVARFQRLLRPEAADGGRLTKSVRLSPADWTWRRLG